MPSRFCYLIFNKITLPNVSLDKIVGEGFHALPFFVI